MNHIGPLAVAAATIAFTLTACGRTHEPATEPPTTVSTAAPTSDTRRNDDHGQDHDGFGAAPSAAPAPAAVDAATGYVQTWARPHLDQPTWFADLQPLVLAGYATLLADTNPANVRSTTLTGAPRVVSSTTATVVVDVPTDSGLVRVTVVSRDTRWLVATAEPAPGPS